MEINQDKSGEVIFNLAIETNRQIGVLLERASDSYLKGDPMRCFYCLKQIKQMIISKLTTDEIKLLTTCEHIVLDKDITKTPYIGLFVEMYQKRVIVLLDKKGYLNPLKESRKKLYDQE